MKSLVRPKLQKRLHVKSLAFAILLAAGAAACAGRPHERPPRGEEGGAGGRPTSVGHQGAALKPIALLLTGMDHNSDLVVDEQELAGGIEQEWQRLLAGRATRAVNFEDWALLVLGTRDALPSFVAFDRSLDGEISREEFDFRIRGEYAELDQNSDGRLERFELVLVVERQTQRESPGGRGGDGGDRGGGGRPPRGH